MKSSSGKSRLSFSRLLLLTPFVLCAIMTYFLFRTYVNLEELRIKFVEPKSVEALDPSMDKFMRKFSEKLKSTNSDHANALIEKTVEYLKSHPNVDNDAAFQGLLLDMVSALNAAPMESPSVPPEFIPSAEDENFHTEQLCYQSHDESEHCVYSNFVCYDGKAIHTIVSKPHPPSMKHFDDSQMSCIDARYYEPTSPLDGGCNYLALGNRRSFDYSETLSPATDMPMSLSRRRWGGTNANGEFQFREDVIQRFLGNHPEILSAPVEKLSFMVKEHYKADEAKVKELMDAGMAEFDYLSSKKDLPTVPYLLNTSVPLIPGSNFTVSRRFLIGDRIINYIDYPLWLVGIEGQWNFNLFHWLTKMSAIFELLRSNRTAPVFGGSKYDFYPQYFQEHSYLVGTRVTQLSKKMMDDELKALERGEIKRLSIVDNPHNPIMFRQGNQWDLPPMERLLFVGSGVVELLKSSNNLESWYRSVLNIVAPGVPTHFFPEHDALNSRNLICSRKAVVVGTKTKLFSGRTDAYMFRLYAYIYGGLLARGIYPHPTHPPRMITIIDRKGGGRGFKNFNGLMKIVQSTGMPYRVVPSLGNLNFQQQLELMATTGILIAPHGAQLTNIVFMPAHSVLIEVFPYGMKKNTYANLCTYLDINYMPISGFLPEWNYSKTFKENEYGLQIYYSMYHHQICTLKNISSYDALTEFICNIASKALTIPFDETQMRLTIESAVDSIGAFSLANPEWKKLAETEGQPLPSLHPIAAEAEKIPSQVVFPWNPKK